MAATNVEIPVIDRGNNKQTTKQSEDLEMKLKVLGIGASNIQVAEDSGKLSVGAPIKASDATATDELASKGQLDDVQSALQDQIDSSGGDISTLSGRMDDAESAIGQNISDIGTNAGAISTNAGNISTNAGNISNLQSSTAQTQSDLDDAEAEIDTLQSDVASVLSNNPAEESQVAGVSGQSVFTLGAIVVDADNTVRDVECFVDGRRQGLATDSNFDQPYKNFRKNSTTEIEFAAPVPEGKVVQFFKQGTAVATSSTLTAISVDPQPSVHAGQSLGTVTKAWVSCFVKDKSTAQVYEIEVNNGTLQATPVP